MELTVKKLLVESLRRDDPESRGRRRDVPDDEGPMVPSAEAYSTTKSTWVRNRAMGLLAAAAKNLSMCID